jgi:hypothetical protein
MGLSPSVYGGGASSSSVALLEDSAFVSRGSAALISAAADPGVTVSSVDNGATAVSVGVPGSVTDATTRDVAGSKKSEEKGGGREVGSPNAEADGPE